MRRTAVQKAPVKHADETGWKKAGHKRWLWVVATADVVVFLIHRLRNAAVVMLLVGKTLQGNLCSDAGGPTTACRCCNGKCAGLI